MATAASETAGQVRLSGAERRLAWLLRLYALLFAAGAVGSLLRPDATVEDIDRVGALLGWPPLPASQVPVASDIWLALAVANMATVSTCSLLAAGDVRARRVCAYPVVVSLVAAAASGLLLFVRWTPAIPFLAITLVALAFAILLVRALRGARPRP